MGPALPQTQMHTSGSPSEGGGREARQVHGRSLAGLSSPRQNASASGEQQARQQDLQWCSGSKAEFFNIHLKESVGTKGGRNELRV